METKYGNIDFLDTDELQDNDGNGHEQEQENAMLRVSEVAKLLGIHPNTVRIWTESGVLRSYRIGPRKDRRIPLTAVRLLLEMK